MWNLVSDFHMSDCTHPLARLYRLSRSNKIWHDNQPREGFQWVGCIPLPKWAGPRRLLGDKWDSFKLPVGSLIGSQVSNLGIMIVHSGRISKVNIVTNGGNFVLPVTVFWLTARMMTNLFSQV